MDSAGGWDAVLTSVRHKLGASAYRAWFTGLEGTVDHDTLVVECPDRFSRDWIRERYDALLREAAAGVERVEYRVKPGARSGSAEVRAPDRATRPLPAVAARPPSREVAPEPALLEAAPAPGSGFDRFVMGPGSALAVEAARAVSRGEAGRCSPLVLTGESGVGKTHLCRAIAESLPEGVLYRSSEQFTTEVTEAMRNGQMPKIRQRYRRSTNVLILEDVHFLEGKKATQVELFHTLDHLLELGRTVVFSSDRPPAELKGLDQKLASRMGQGLVARIGPPDADARRGILTAKAAGGGVRVPEECIELLAQRPVRSVRDLLSGLNQVVARATLLKRPIDVALVQAALAEVEVPGRAWTLEEIRSAVSRAYSISVEELCGRSRRRRVVRPRQLAMYLCRHYTEASLKEIGRAFDRDHTSVLYAVEVTERRVVEKPQLRYEVEALAARFSPTATSRS
jgi:chromosomal replication initiator protein